MKKLILLVILAFSMVLSPLATTIAATPKVINYQGQLESDAITSQAPVLVVFELFEDAAGGSALWIEQKSVTVDKNGFFSVYLGDVNPIDVKFDKQYYVQVTVGNNQPFPRTKLSSTPSAFHAVDADTALHAYTADLAYTVAPKAINLANLADEVLTAGGDLMGMYPNPQIKPSAIIDNIPDGSITSEMLSPNISTSPSGPAGGDLSGVYPDPLIAVGAVKTDRIFDAAVTNEKIANGAVTNNKIVSMDAAKLTNVPALNYMVAVATDATIDGDGTLAMPLGLADNAVSTPKIVDGAVTNAKVGADAITTDKILNETILAEDIATGAVTTDEILDETIIAADIATGAVTTDEILDETILATDIATGAVTTDEILDETILATDIATGAVTTSEILNATILEEDIADDAVTNAKLAADAVRVEQIDVNGAGPVDGDVLYFDAVDMEMRWGQERVETSAPLTGDGSTATPVTLDPTYGSADELLIRTAPTGWVSSKINTANINDAAITNVLLADNSVTTSKIMDGEVMTADLMDLGVTTGKIADMGVTTGKIADLNVTNGKIADNAITTAKILDGEVMNADLANGSVTTAKILDGQVMTDDLMDLGVTTAKLADNSVTTGKILDGEVQTADLDDAAVTTAKLADNSVNGDKVIDASLSSLDLNATGVTAGIYGDPSANPSEIDVAEFNVDAQGRITAAVERTYTVLAAGTIFNESAVSDITVDGTYDNLDLQIKPGVVGNVELGADAVTTDKILDGEVMTADLMNLGVTTAKIADMNVTTGKLADDAVTTIKILDGAVTSGKILDGDVQTVDLADGSVTSAKIADLGIATVDYANNSVTNAKIGSGAEVAGRVIKADGAGNTVWGDDLGLTLPYTGSYDGPGDAFTISHTGVAGAGSVAVFTSGDANNTDAAVEITKGVNAGAGAALAVSGTGVTGTNYIATMENTNGIEGRTLLLENNAGVIAAQITDPNGIPNSGDEYVTPDPTGTDLNDATLVVRNSNAAVSNQKLAIKTYGSIQANSTVQGTNLVAHGGQVTLLNPTTGAVATLMPPTNVGDPLNITPAVDINGTSTVNGLNNIWESADGNLFPAGTGTDRDVPTALAVSNSIGSIAAEPFITFQADGGGLTNNRVFAVNSTLTSTVNAGDNANIDLSINLANANTWTGTQTLSAAGNGLVVTTNADFQGNIANTFGDVTVNDNLDVNNNLNVDGTTTLDLTATIGGNALAAPAIVAENNDVSPTIVATNGGVGSSIDATGNVTINAGGLDVTGATDLNTGLNVDGASTLDATTVNGTFDQTGGAQVTISGNVDASNGIDVTAGGLNVTGATDLNTGLNVDGASTLDATTIDGLLTANGAINQTVGQVTFAGNVDANSGLDLVGNFTYDGETITNIDNTAEGLVSGDAGLPTSGNVATAIAAVADAQFLTLALDGDLANERVATFSANFATVDGGANANYDIDLSNTGVGAAAYGLAAGTTYPTFTVDAKGRLTAAANQAIVVDDVVASDISITGALSNALDLQIDADVVTSAELANDNYDTELLAGNYTLGNLDGTVIGNALPAAGTFTNLTANTDFTLGAAPNTVDDIYISTDGTNPMAGALETQLVTAKTVMDALANHDLQVAYNNGNAIVTNGNAIDFTLTNGAFNVTTAAGNDLNVTGAGVVDIDVNTELNGNLTHVGNNTMTGNTIQTGNNTLNGALSVTGLSTLATVDINGGNIDGTVIGATTAAAGTFTTVNAASVTASGNVEGATITESGNAVPNETESPNAAGDISGTYAAGLTIDNDAVQSAELDETDAYAFTGLVSFTNIDVNGGAIDGTPVGATAASTGAFTTLSATGASTLAGVTASGLVTANAGLTVGAAQNFTLGGNGVDDIMLSTDAPLANNDDNLVTEGAVFTALAAHTLQTAYVNGNVITTSVGEGNVQIAGTEMLDIDVNTTLDGNLTHVGNNTMTGNLGVTGTSTLAGVLTQTGGGNQVTFAGNVDANNGLDVTGATNLTGTVAQSGGNVTLNGAVSATNGVAVQGGVNITTGSLNVAVGNGAIGGNFSVVGTSDLQGAVSNTTGALTIGDDLVVTGTSDLQGVISNSTADVTVNDGLSVALQAAAESVNITSSTRTGAVLDVAKTGGDNAYAASIAGVERGATISTTGGGAGNIGLNVSAFSGTDARAIIATNSGTGANAAIVASNIEGSSDAYAVSVGAGHIKASADGATVATPASVTVGSNTVIRLTTAGGAHGPINIDAGTQVGQIIIITNEDAGTLSLNVLGGSYIVPANSAVQLVWNSAAWVKVD